jgi:hypothetical protein
MIEYGLSVSLGGTPKTPHGNSPIGVGGGAPRKMMKFGDFSEEEDDDYHGRGDIGDSISPRVLFSGDDVSRRLDFSWMPLNNPELSPVSFGSASSIPRGGGGAEGAGEGVETSEPESVGDCVVCYKPLQKRANHVFTMCGHLFCVHCFLRWWDTSSTCPMCRAELFVQDANAADASDVANAVDADDDADDDDDAPDVDGERLNEYFHAELGHNPPLYNIDSDSSDSGDNDREENVEEDRSAAAVVPLSNVTMMSRYLHQDRGVNWSPMLFRFRITDPNFDDTVVPLSQNEIQSLRHNREIARTLFARIRFRETLLSQDIEFLGGVHTGRLILQQDWIESFTYQYQHLDTGNTKMYEFVIRRGSEFSPIVETNVFGFIKEITIVNANGGDDTDHDDYDWENLHEYAFVAEIFSPSLFQIDRNGMRMCYGDYIMDEGTILPAHALIRFSHIRRLYCISGCERWSA